MGTVIGLVIGTYAGARWATGLRERRLRVILLGLVLLNTLPMIWKALR